MIDNSLIELEGKKYLVVDTITNENIKYVYLTNQDDVGDFLVQKEIIENEEDAYLVNLENEEEFNKAMCLFEEKNK